MSDTPIVDIDILRDQVRDKYRAVAIAPDATPTRSASRPQAHDHPLANLQAFHRRPRST